jgi:TonB family protein
MTGGPFHRMDVAGPRAHGDAGDLSDVVPLAERETASSAPPISATNVIPFVRARRDAPPASSAADIAFDPAARPAPLLIGRERRIQIAALLALSLAVHAGVYVLFNRDPEPMASIGLEPISVEIVMRDNRPLSASTPGQVQTKTVPADDPKPNPLDHDTTVAKVEETRPTEVRPVEAPQRLAETAVSETAPERPRTQAAETPPAPRAAETPPERLEQPRDVAVLRSEETPASSREPELSAAPEEPAKATPAEPDRPEPVRTETRPQPQPKAAPKQEAKKKQDTRPKERPGPQTRTASTDPNPTGPRQRSESGAGPASAGNANYRGIVFAHLARQKRYPAEAGGAQGRAMVNFSLDGSGRVTRVSLVSRAGHAALDQEATAMVRRASPFPPPPDGRPLNFTAPVSFRAQ